MSQWSASPDLVNRRLITLVTMLESAALSGITVSGGLSVDEMRLWAKLNRTYINASAAMTRDPNADLIG